MSGCVAGGAVVEAGGGVLAHGRRLQAAALLLRTTVLQSFFKFFYQLAAFPSYISVPLPFGSFSTLFGSFCFLSFFFSLCFSLLSFSLFFRSSLVRVSFPLLSRSLFSFSSPPFFLPFLLLFGLFIEPKGGAFYGCTWGARAAAVGRPFGCSCRGSASCFLGRCAAGGRPVSSVGGPTAWGFGLVRRVVQRERGNAFCFFRKRNNQRKPFFFPPVLHVQGRKKEEQCRSKRHRSVFFFLHETASF